MVERVEVKRLNHIENTIFLGWVLRRPLTLSTRSKFLKGVASFSALFMASTGIASASGPDVGDNFTVTFNGQASLSVGYQSGDLIAAPTIAGSTWGSPGAILSPPLSVLLGGGRIKIGYESPLI